MSTEPSREDILKAHDRKRELAEAHIPEFAPQLAPVKARPVGAGMKRILERLKERAQQPTEDRPCCVCGEMTADVEEPPLCGRTACERRLRAKRWASLPKEELLRHTRTPELYREPFDVNRIRGPWRGEWPRSFNGSVPANEWAGDPPTVVLVSQNQMGKSRLAAEMMFRAVRAGEGSIPSACWIVAHEIYEEDRTEPLGAPRPLLHRVKTAGILVVDDFGWSTQSIETLAALAELRHSSRRPTIWTSHLSLGKGQRTIKELAPMIYGRMMAGLAYSLGNRRGSPT